RRALYSSPGVAWGQLRLRRAPLFVERLGSLQSLLAVLFGRGLGTALVDQFPGVVGGFGLDHHDGDIVTGDTAGNHHVEHGVLQLGVAREGNPLRAVAVVNQGHAYATDRTGERQTGELGGHGGGVDGDHVVELIRVDGHDGDDYLDLVAQALNEGRTQRAVHQTAGQDSLGRGTAFTTEEAARD